MKKNAKIVIKMGSTNITYISIKENLQNVFIIYRSMKNQKNTSKVQNYFSVRVGLGGSGSVVERFGGGRYVVMGSLVVRLWLWWW